MDQQQGPLLPPVGYIRLQVEAYGLFRFITLVSPQTRVEDLKKGVLPFPATCLVQWSNCNTSIHCRDNGTVWL